MPFRWFSSRCSKLLANPGAYTRHMTGPGAQPPESKQPPKARMARWPNPLLVIVIGLWVVPGAVMFSPTPFGEWLELFASFTLTILVWLALPIPMVIGGLVWIARMRPAPRPRWLWVIAWAAVVAIGAPAVFFLPRIIGPIGHGVTYRDRRIGHRQHRRHDHSIGRDPHLRRRGHRLADLGGPIGASAARRPRLARHGQMLTPQTGNLR